MGGSHYLNYAGSGSNFDFFHIGALLVVIMAIVTGIVLCVAVVGVCCFHWLDDFQDRKKISPHPHNPQSHTQISHRHHSDSRRHSNSTATSAIIGPPSSSSSNHRDRDVLGNSFIRNHIIRFEECPYPSGKILVRDAAKTEDEEPPPPYDFLFPAQTTPETTQTLAAKMSLSLPPPLTADAGVTVSNEDRNSGDASTRF